jgi:hypothetical protein
VRLVESSENVSAMDILFVSGCYCQQRQAAVPAAPSLQLTVECTNSCGSVRGSNVGPLVWQNTYLCSCYIGTGPRYYSLLCRPFVRNGYGAGGLMFGRANSSPQRTVCASACHLVSHRSSCSSVP